MELPYANYREIAEYVRDQYLEYNHTQPSSSEVLHSRESFALDLTGTKYEVLGKIGIQITFEAGNDDAHGSIQSNALGPEYPITIGLDRPIHDITNTLEHELIHAVQLEYKKRTGGKVAMGPKRRKNDKYDYDGTPNDGGDRIAHHKRPIEFQTNLNSLIRKLSNTYSKRVKSYPNRTHSKKEYFKKEFIPYIASQVQGDLELKRKYTSAAYKHFMSDESGQDEDQYELERGTYGPMMRGVSKRSGKLLDVINEEEIDILPDDKDKMYKLSDFKLNPKEASRWASHIDYEKSRWTDKETTPPDLEMTDDEVMDAFYNIPKLKQFEDDDDNIIYKLPDTPENMAHMLDSTMGYIIDHDGDDKISALYMKFLDQIGMLPKLKKIGRTFYTAQRATEHIESMKKNFG